LYNWAQVGSKKEESDEAPSSSPESLSNAKKIFSTSWGSRGRLDGRSGAHVTSCPYQCCFISLKKLVCPFRRVTGQQSKRKGRGESRPVEKVHRHNLDYGRGREDIGRTRGGHKRWLYTWKANVGFSSTYYGEGKGGKKIEGTREKTECEGVDYNK